MREMVERMVELNPNEPSALRDMGWLLWFTGHADEALPYLKKALELTRLRVSLGPLLHG